MPKFKTFRDLDRFLHVWNRGLNWLKEQQVKADRLKTEADNAQLRAVEAQKQADIARKPDVEPSETAESSKEEYDAKQKQDYADAAKKQADEMREEADSAQNLIGFDNRQQLSKVMHLWRLAASVIFDKKYKDFVETDIKEDGDWFGPRLPTTSLWTAIKNLIEMRNREL
jgi:hypothetical protein